ncbi:MAG: glycoside hydrolase family 125 protein [Prevotella sp.]
MQINIQKRPYRLLGILFGAFVISTPLHAADHMVAAASSTYVSRRPPVEKRTFVSPAVDQYIEQLASRIRDPKLRWLFENCFPNTVDTTVKFQMKDGQPDTFVITGDIDAMWLRDSSAQVWNYIKLMKNDPRLQQMIKGLLRRQFHCIITDSYANAFNDGPTGQGWHSDNTKMAKEVNERKWEIDSLCYPLRLLYAYWKETGDNSIFDDLWEEAMRKILQTFGEQQRKTGVGPYSFSRQTGNPIGTLVAGVGNPVNPVGLVVSCFRPSDDATIFGFLIPSNMFIVSSLRQLNEMIASSGQGTQLLTESSHLAQEVDTAIKRYGIVKHPKHGKIFAYEVDGFGGQNLMDDANVPSLLAVPYMGYTSVKDPVYKRTRRFVWSKDNPYYFQGKAGEGIGGPHCGQDRVWPMSITMKGLTADNRDEVRACLKMLVNTDGGAGFMHESFHKDNANDFGRPWFAWANSLFGELIVRVAHDYPELLDELYAQ